MPDSVLPKLQKAPSVPFASSDPEEEPMQLSDIICDPNGT
jgi:hypothetical protein